MTVPVRHRRCHLILAITLAGGSANAEAPQTAAASTQPAAEAAAQDDARARRLCDALHTLPAVRRGACCGTVPKTLADACARELTDAIRRATIKLDATAIDRCAADTAERLQGCGWVTPLLPPLPDACRNLVAGILAAGSPCRSALECLDGLYCRGVSPTDPGACAPPARPEQRCESSPGDNLAALTRATGDPRHPTCDGQCARGRCLPFVPLGAPCNASGRCTPGLNCIAARCVAERLPAIGEPCPGKTGCVSGAFCQEGQCAPFKGAGEPCKLPFECRALACEKVPGGATGTCGDPCGVSSAKSAAAANPAKAATSEPAAAR